MRETQREFATTERGWKDESSLKAWANAWISIPVMKYKTLNDEQCFIVCIVLFEKTLEDTRLLI